MQVQKRIDELSVLRASEWIDLLPDASPRQLREFDAWLSESRLHVRDFLDIAEVEFCLGRLDPQRQQDIDSLLRRLRPQTANLPESAEVGPFSTLRRTLASRLAVLAAAASLLVALGLVTVHFLPESKRYTTAIGEQRVVELHDASRITLNADSQIKVRFVQRLRDVDLQQGEALFQVSHDAQRPFRVRTRAGLVQAIGTRFNVYDRTDGDTRVSVLEGKVLAVSKSMSQLVLAAGEEADMRADGTIARRAHPNVANAIAWREHRLIFENATLEEIAAEFNRYNQSPRLRVEGLEGNGYRFDGSFETTDPEAFVQMLAKEPDLTITRRNGEVTIRKR